MAKAPRTFPDTRPTISPRACGRCGRHITDTPLNQPCLQCGWCPSVRCISCGYDLAGLDESGPCPECATPIAQSIRGDGLAFAGEAYLRSISQGLALVRWALLFIVITFLGVLMGYLLLPTLWMALDARVVYLLPLGLNALGWWCLTAHDPMIPSESDTIARAGARYSAVALVVLWALRSGFSPLPLALDTFAECAVSASVVVHVCLAGTFLRWLAMRANRRRIATSARRVAGMAIIILALVVVGFGLRAAGFFPRSLSMGSGGPLDRLLFIATVAMNVTLLVGGVSIVSRLFTISHRLRADIQGFLRHGSPHTKTPSEHEARA